MAESERLQAARINAELSGLVERGVRTIAVTVLDSVAASTPVATGASAASWVANTRPVGPVVKRTGSAVAAAQAASRAKVLAYRLSSGPVHVVSSQPGIEQLNNGSSRREPAAFVQRAIAKAVTTTRVLTLTAGRRGGGR